MMEFMEYAKMECNLQFGWLSHATAVCVFIFIRFDIHTNWHLWKQNCNRIISPVAFSQNDIAHNARLANERTHSAHSLPFVCTFFPASSLVRLKDSPAIHIHAMLFLIELLFSVCFLWIFTGFFCTIFFFFKFKFSAWLDLIGIFRVWWVGGEGLLRVDQTCRPCLDLHSTPFEHTLNWSTYSPTPFLLSPSTFSSPYWPDF